MDYKDESPEGAGRPSAISRDFSAISIKIYINPGNHESDTFVCAEYSATCAARIGDCACESLFVKTRIKSRVETSMPNPSEAKRLSETERRALELSGEIEHEHGEEREDKAREAQSTREP